MRLLCAAMLLVTFAACDELDNQNDNPGGGDNSDYSTLILGAWRVDQMTVNGQNMTPPDMQLSFYENCSGLMNGGGIDEHNEFTWAISGSNISVTTDNNQFTFVIDNLTATECSFHGNRIQIGENDITGDIVFHMIRIGGDNPGDPDDPDPGNLGVSAPIMLENTITSLKMRSQITGDLDTYLSQFPDYTFGFIISCDAPPSVDHNAVPCYNRDQDGTFTLLLSGLESGKDYMVAAWLRLTPESEPIVSSITVMSTINSLDPSVYWVDLGLPSGTIWAVMNIGASSPLEFGGYYAWGETQTKSTYSWDNYLYGHGSHQLTKYCYDPSYGLNGYTDNLTTLEISDDAAYGNPFGNARIPTKTEWEELVNNTTHVWLTEEGISGWKFTASNGNSIFLPAAGYKTTNVNDIYQTGHYWSATLGADGPDYAWQLGFTATQIGGDMQTMTRSQRWAGQSVRAVRSSADDK